jgi:lysylphosphatidylglycerol synthetase-like protein (DUF2156 family)
MKKRPLTVNVTLIFVIINALIWLILGMIIALHLHPSLPDNPVIRWSMAFLSFAAAAILIGLFFLLRRQIPVAWFFSVGFFVLSALLTFFDQFGLTDLVVLVINVIPIILLIKDRAWFLRRMSSSPTS